MPVNPTRKVDRVHIGDANEVLAYNKPSFADASGTNDILFSEHVLPQGARYDEVASLIGKLRGRLRSEAPGRDVMLIQIDTPRGEPERVAFVWADELRSKEPVSRGDEIRVVLPAENGQRRVERGRVLEIRGEVEHQEGFWDKVFNVLSTIATAAMCILGIWMTVELGVLGFILVGWFPIVAAASVVMDVVDERKADASSRLLPGLELPR